MNYLDFFKLAEEPYNYLKTNPRYFYNAPGHRFAKAILNDSINNKSGNVYLTGPIGIGKTTLIRAVESDIQGDQENLVFYTYSPKGIRTPLAFLKRLCREMGIEFHRTFEETLNSFEGQIGKWARENKTPIIMIDEAHKLTPPALDLVHHVLNFVTDKKLLVVFVLAGQKQLVNKIRRKPELRSRLQAITLSELTENDTSELVKWRWRVASIKKDNSVPFNKEALRVVHRAAKGIPRDICSICNRALQYASATEAKTIGPELIKKAVESLEL